MSHFIEMGSIRSNYHETVEVDNTVADWVAVDRVIVDCIVNLVDHFILKWIL